MTKLAPIEELADKLEIHYECHYDSINDRDYTEYTLTEYQLEALRQAIIRDFVSTLEPVHSQFFDVDKWYDYLNEKHKKNTIEAGYLHRDLYDLSEWSNK